MSILKRNSGYVLESKGYKQSATPVSLISNGDVSNGTTGWSAASSSHASSYDVLFNTGSGASASPRERQITTIAALNNITYYITGMARVNNSICSSLEIQLGGTLGGVPTGQLTLSSPIKDKWYKLSLVVSLTSGASGFILFDYIHRYASAGASSGMIMELKGLMAIDITNRPASEQTIAWCDANLPFRTETGTPSRWAIDRSRNQNNGTFSNVTWTQLPSGLWVINFNGTTSYVEIADSPSMRMTRGGTILAWVKANSIGGGGEGRIIDKGTSTSSANGYCISMIDISSLHYLYFRINAGALLLSTSIPSILGNWKMVAVTFSSAGRIIYINAVNSVGSGGSETVLPPNVSGVVRIGNRAGATDRARAFDGQIALPRIYNRVLSQVEIARIYNSQRGFFGV